MKAKDKAQGFSSLVDYGRHEIACTVCAHPDKEAIELAFIEWESPSRIAKQHKVAVRALYRHAHAAGLFLRRDKNIRAALGNIIVRGGRCRVSAHAVVQACMALARLNSSGQLISRVESVDVNLLFDRMSNIELDAYARDGQLPDWFTKTVGALPDTQVRQKKMKEPQNE
jgi:hypothetical protein